MPFFINSGPHRVDNGPVPLPLLMLSLYASTMAQWQDEPTCYCCCNGRQQSFVVTLSSWKITILLLFPYKATKTIVCCYLVIVEDSSGSLSITILLLSAYKPTKTIVCCYSVIVEDSSGSPTPLPNPPPAYSKNAFLTSLQQERHGIYGKVISISCINWYDTPSNSTEHSKPSIHESILSLRVRFPQKHTYHVDISMLLRHKFATLHN
jgi:hypothetical protein